MAACGGGGGGPAAVKPGATISGTWTYESVAATVNGLNYAQITKKPIRGAVVQLITQANNAIVATSATTETGTFSLAYSGTGSVIVRVLAQTTTPPIQVEDDTAGNAIWSAQSPAIDFNNVSVTGQDLIAPLGWDTTVMPNKYTGNRVSGAFSILDVIYTASTAVTTARPLTVLPTCKIRWSPNSVATGSFYNGSEIVIVGKENVDTDEFDRHVLVHEWGHFFEDKLSRSDSPGEDHTFGDLLVPSLAFGEGYGYGLAAIILSPDVVSVDTAGPLQANGDGAWSVETPEPFAALNPGWFSETTVAALMLDLFDDTATEALDQVALGLGPILDVLTGPQRTTAARTTIFSFLHGLKQANAAAAAAIDTLVGPAISPVVDEWGSNETHDGGVPYHLPAYHQIAIGGAAVVVTLHGTAGGAPVAKQSNKLPANRFLRFTGSGAQVTVNATTTVPAGMANDHDIALFVFLGAAEVATANAVASGTETVTFASQAGVTYVIQIVDQGNLNGTFTATVAITN